MQSVTNHFPNNKATPGDLRGSGPAAAGAGKIYPVNPAAVAKLKAHLGNGAASSKTAVPVTPPSEQARQNLPQLPARSGNQAKKGAKMKITHIELEFGMTQNLGDYTNCRPSIKMMAEVGEDDDPAKVLDQLNHIVRPAVHNLVDDELEAAGLEVKYFSGKLYTVSYSDVRQCIIIHPSNTRLPVEKNWKEGDVWNDYNSNFPGTMRLGTAHRAAQRRHEGRGYPIFDCSDGNLESIPPLPDAGPEPLWSIKNLAPKLRQMNIDKSLWAELAALEYVTEEYLIQVRGEHGWHTPAETYLAFIRENKPFTPDAEDDYDDEHEDWED